MLDGRGGEGAPAGGGMDDEVSPPASGGGGGRPATRSKAELDDDIPF